MVRDITIPRQLELRTIPTIFKAQPGYGSDYRGSITASILVQIYGSMLNGWLYGGLVELAYSGSRPSWTSQDSWTFAPVDTSHLSIPEVQTIGSNSTTGDATAAGAAANLTVDTPGMRARLACTEIDLSNTSAWLMPLNFTKNDGWNMSTVPPGLDDGYALSASDDGFFPIDLGPYKESWKNNKTTFFSDRRRLTCCANETEGSPGRVAIG